MPGGTARSALELVAALDRRGIVDPVGVRAHHRDDPAPAFRPPIPTAGLPLPRLALYEAWHRLGRPGVERATGPVDVVHATGVAVPPRTAPLVVTIHDLAFVHHPDHPTRWGARFFRKATAAARDRADLVLCPSEATARDCIEQGFAPDRVRVIPWGVDQTIANRDAIATVRGKYALPDRFVLFTGTIEPRKNLPALLAAHRELGGETPLVIAGPVGWNEDLAEPLRGIESTVLLLGFVPPESLGALYAAATVFCYPSLLEGFGLPVLEAMVQSTPVITSAGTSTAEVGGDAVVLIDPRDHGELTDALADLLADEGRAQRLGRAGAARAAEFTWERTAAMHESAYADLARR